MDHVAHTAFPARKGSNNLNSSIMSVSHQVLYSTEPGLLACMSTSVYIELTSLQQRSIIIISPLTRVKK